MSNLALYELIENMRAVIGDALDKGVPELAIYLAVQDLTREVIKPQMEAAVQRDLTEVKVKKNAPN